MKFVKQGQAKVTIIIPLRHISESESLVPRGSHECLGGSSGAVGGPFHYEKVISTAFIFLWRALGGSSEADRVQLHGIYFPLTAMGSWGFSGILECSRGLSGANGGQF